ncbi:MAG: phage major capsid protein [Chromatiales bacterium]|nr:phage major capsid protein [Chromatiales bacterium]
MRDPNHAPIIEAVDSLGKDWAAFKASQAAELRTLSQRQDELEARAENIRPGASGNASAAERKQFADYLRTGQGLSRKDVTTGTASGAMVPTVIAQDIVSKALARSRIGALVRNAQVESGDYSRILRVGGATSGWSSETGTRSATTEPSYRAITPTSGELYSYYTVSNWALQDAWFDLAKELEDAVTAQAAKDLEAAIISGNGASRPTGMLASNPTSADDNASPQRAAGVYEYVASGEAGTLNHHPASSPQRYGDDKLLDLFFTLKPEYRANATWLMASPTLAAVRKFKDTNGQPVWQPNMAAGVDQGDGFLFGKPVVVCESMPAIGSNAFPIAVGDLQQGYELVRIHGLDITRDDVTSPGKTKFFVRARFGGCVLDNDAIKFIKCSAS